MKIKRLVPRGEGRWQFDLNVGGFNIRGCWWYEFTGQIVFPRRYSRSGARFRVVFAHGRRVQQLRELLESGLMEAPRDRRPCTLKVRFRGQSRREYGWWVFDFTVRGFTILGCRWHPDSGSIQLPVTFGWLPNDEPVTTRVVRSYGAHVNRLRVALEAKASGERQDEAAHDVIEEAAVLP